MQFEWDLFWLLPIVALSGWYLGRSQNKQDSRRFSKTLYPEYFKGLNFVLNEQPDKAIEVFIRMLEVDSETVETHLALGNLFRRRGEVDRAIRIHQNLIARSTLNREQRDHALFELGIDYMRSGLLDRAEGLFLELVDSNGNRNLAYKQLLEIYQQEKEWNKAIAIAKKLGPNLDYSLNPIIAQYYCECADAELTQGNRSAAKNCLNQAIRFDKNCVRASLIEAQMQQQLGKDKLAIKVYKRVESQHSDFIVETLEPLLSCYRRLDQIDKFSAYLEVIVKRYGGISMILMLTELIAERDGKEAAIRFMVEQLKERPAVKGIERLLEYTLSEYEGDLDYHLNVIKTCISKLMEEGAIYKCNHCGFDAKSLYWQCPGCKKWNTVKPVLGVIGE